MDGLEKKEKIDAILKKFSTRMTEQRRKRDGIITRFLEAMNEKSVEKIRNQLKQL